MDMNVNSTECLKTVNFIGYQEVHNICTGAVATVNWGTADYIGAIALGFGAIILAIMFFAMAVGVIREVFFGWW